MASFSQRKIGRSALSNRRFWDQAIDRNWLATPAELARGTASAPSSSCASSGPSPEKTCSWSSRPIRQAEVRSRAVALLGLHSSAPVRQALVKALGDADPFVRRHACEGLMQQPAGEIPVEALLPLLSDPDRFIRFAARVAIEHGDPGSHRDRLLAITDPRGLIEGMLALARATRLDEAGQDELLEARSAIC